MKGAADGTSSGVDKFSQRDPGHLPLYQRAVVHEVIFDPSSLTDEQIDDLKRDIRFTANVRRLPRNTIVGERIKTGQVEVNGKELFFPFFSPHLALPVKPGEQVWVFFEDPSMVDAQGFWVSRVSEVRDVDDVNHTHADRKFDRRGAKSTADKASAAATPTPGFNNGVVGDLDGESVSARGTASVSGGPDAYRDIQKKSEAARVQKYSPVPRFTKRPGDFVAQGSNNAVIVLGTDRAGSAAEGEPGTRRIPASDAGDGAAVISVGRGQTPKTAPAIIANELGRSEVDKSIASENKGEGDFDFENDAVTVYLAMSTSADKLFGVKHSSLDDTSSDRAHAAVVKADQIRLVARQDIKFMVKASEDTPDDEAAMFVIKSSGAIVFIPSKTGLLYFGGEDADLSPLCTRENNRGSGGEVTATPITDTMGGVQGSSDGTNGTFPRKVLFK